IDQYDQLHDWLFGRDDIVCGEPGDLIFFAESLRPDVVVHNGIIWSVDDDWLRYSIIWASTSRGCVTEDEFIIRGRTFKDLVCRGVAKMRPFLLRHFLYKEIQDRAENMKG
ncbi:MAG: hypothetical protein DRN07_08645, partial [Thermoplasmata archaeon]